MLFYNKMDWIFNKNDWVSAKTHFLTTSFSG